MGWSFDMDVMVFIFSRSRRSPLQGGFRWSFPRPEGLGYSVKPLRGALGSGNVRGVPGRNKESFCDLLWRDRPRKTESALELLARYEPKSLFFVEHYCRRMFFACNDACPRIVPRPGRQGQVNRLERCSDRADHRSEGAKDRR